MHNLTARDIMSRKVITVQDDLPVTSLARVLTEHGISGAPVLNAKGRLVGVVSVMDIVSNELKVGHNVITEADFYARPELATRAELRGTHVEDYNDSLVRDIMTPVVISVGLDATVVELANVMGVNRIHRVLVTEEDTVVGVVSALDIISLITPEGLAERSSGNA